MVFVDETFWSVTDVSGTFDNQISVSSVFLGFSEVNFNLSPSSIGVFNFEFSLFQKFMSQIFDWEFSAFDGIISKRGTSLFVEFISFSSFFIFDFLVHFFNFSGVFHLIGSNVINDFCEGFGQSSIFFTKISSLVFFKVSIEVGTILDFVSPSRVSFRLSQFIIDQFPSFTGIFNFDFLF